MEKVEKGEIALLLGIDIGEDDVDVSLDELERLASTAEIETGLRGIQKRDKPDNACYIGRGKAEEFAAMCKDNNITIVIADDELKGSQIRELEEIFDLPVIDRTTLILDIFAMRATSLEGQLQVELAQYRYRLPRLTGMGKSLSRLGGGIGTRGPGETKLETDKRHIRRKMFHIEEELASCAKRRALSRQKRQKDGVPTVALVGYTNAGKSSLMNVLCQNADVYVKDQLFATLDPTIRCMKNEDNMDVLLVDTVGFIRKLPHALINAFSSTLEESFSADLLLHVVDYSDKEVESQTEIVSKLLFDLGAASKPTFLILNKCDIAEKTDIATIMKYSMIVFETSAKTGEGLEELKEAIFKEVLTSKIYNLTIPYSDGNVINTLHEKTKVISTEHKEDGTHICAKINNDDIKKFERYIHE